MNIYFTDLNLGSFFTQKVVLLKQNEEGALAQVVQIKNIFSFVGR